MVFNFFLILHIIIVVSLVSVILVQRGRSGGLVEALGGVESIFGTKTSAFFVKATVILAILFFLSSIFLAYLSKERGKSLMEKYKSEADEETSFSEQPFSQEQTEHPEAPTATPFTTGEKEEEPASPQPQREIQK